MLAVIIQHIKIGTKKTGLLNKKEIESLNNVQPSFILLKKAIKFNLGNLIYKYF